MALAPSAARFPAICCSAPLPRGRCLLDPVGTASSNPKQVNRSDEIGARSEDRLNAAKQRSEELGVLSLLKGLHTHLLYFSAGRPEAVLPVKCVASNATD